MIIYVLTHEYSDHSAFDVCGVTQDIGLATTWCRANDESNVYETDLAQLPNHWMEGVEGWRQRDRKVMEKELAMKGAAAMAVPLPKV